MDVLKWACSLLTIALRKKCRSRRFGRFHARGLFLPDMPRGGEAANRDGAGPVNVVATHVAATAIERVHKYDATAPLNAEELPGNAVRFNIPGTLENLAAIEKSGIHVPRIISVGHAHDVDRPHGREQVPQSL
jgi:hypothetical protein